MSHTDVPIQALRSEYDVVILEHEDKEWRVDLEKMIQKPVNQPFMKHRWRHVRYLVQESNQASAIKDETVAVRSLMAPSPLPRIGCMAKTGKGPKTFC